VGDLEAAPVLDSDILIDHLRDRGPGRDLVDTLNAGSGFRLTAVSAFELALGKEYGQDPSPADAVLAAPCLTLTRMAAVRGGALLRELRAEGRGIDVRDAMQAAICLEAGAPLVTRNVRHFARIAGLDVSAPGGWTAPA
jgi:predicted nucleic acid-binding protein